MASTEVSLYINGEPLQIKEFVQDLIRVVVIGMLSSLKGVEGIKSVNLSIVGDEVGVVVNGAAVPSNAFVQEFLKNTVDGMVASLKDVGKVDKLEIIING